MSENFIADPNAVDRHDSGVGRDRDPRRQTDSTRDARLLADRGLRGLRINPDDFRAGPLRWAEGDALEMAALGLTSILEHDRDPHDEFDEP